MDRRWWFDDTKNPGWRRQCLPMCIAMILDKPLGDVLSQGRPPTIQAYSPYLYAEGYMVMGFYPVIRYLSGGSTHTYSTTLDPETYLAGELGLLDYGNHCCAWLQDHIWDPRQSSTPLDRPLESFHLIRPV